MNAMVIKNITKNDIELTTRYDDVVKGCESLMVECKIADNCFGLLATHREAHKHNSEAELFITKRSCISDEFIIEFETVEPQVIKLSEEYGGSFLKEIETMRLTMLDMINEYF